jgi:hypothetical protein
MQVMGELAGPSGEVIGLDRDVKAGREAVDRLQATGTSRYRRDDLVHTFDQWVLNRLPAEACRA